MCEKNAAFFGFENNAAKSSLVTNKFLIDLINRFERGIHFVTSTPKVKEDRMEMNHDSGYISHNTESNSDTSIENLSELVTNNITSSRLIYLSEDALLEIPEVNVNLGNLSGQVEKENDEKTRNSPDVIISSVVSQETTYSALENDSNSDMSLEIPIANKIIMENMDGNSNPETNPYYIDDVQSKVGTWGDMNEKVGEFDYNYESSLNTYGNGSKFIDVSSINSQDNILSRHENLLSNMPHDENGSLSAVTVTNTCSPATNEKKNKLTLIFSKCDKENVYSVKRKYRSLTPEDSMKNTDKGEDTLLPKKHMEPKAQGNSSSSKTPEKKYVNSVDPNVSPDLFGEEESAEEQKNEANCTYIAEEKYVIKNDRKLLKRVQNDLKGVLPPFSMTVVQMSINEILNRLESNKDYFWTNDCAVKKTEEDKGANSSNISNESSVTGEPSSLLITGSFEESVNKSWPEILEGRYHGLHFNRSKISEEFEDLCAKYAQRYVGAETQSSCTVFETNFASPVKRKQLKQRWPVKSPGRRLSHLAKRRITFSSSNLQPATSSVASSRARQILVDARKLDLLNRRRSPRKSPRKTPRKSPRVKNRTPSSSAKKKLAIRFRALTGEIEQTSTSYDNHALISKRALFQSPDSDKNSNLFLPSTSGTSNFKNDLKNPNTKRALFISPSKRSPIKKSPFKRSPFKRLELGIDNKRKRSDPDDMRASKILKSDVVDVYPSESELKGKLSRTASDMNISLNRSSSSQCGDLSIIHKKKLQWAVYEALRSQNITPSHAQFKIFASTLARVTRRFLPNLANNAPRPEGGTSERMFRIARHHVYAVVKGKSVDEIVNDHIRNRLKNVKPQGYVGIEQFNERNKQMINNKENTIQGRITTLESLEKKKVEQLGSDNKIERIRKVINFGDDNR